MRAVLQRVKRASVVADGELLGAIEAGLLVLLGVAEGDDETDADFLAAKTAALRIFPDEEDKMNRSVTDVGGEVLVISQFTLLGDARKGRRPSFAGAADPETGNRLYEYYRGKLAEAGLKVATGRFAARMDVELVNDGPVTILLDSRKVF